MKSKFEVDKRFLDQLGKRLGYSHWEDWYRLKWKDIPKTRHPILKSLLSQFGDSPSKLLSHYYPHRKYLFWRFGLVWRDKWSIRENRIEYVEWLGSQLDFKSMEDWYKITYKDIIEKEGGKILGQFGNSPTKMITSVYEHHPWLLWKFRSLSNEFWNHPKNQKDFLDWLSVELGMKEMNHWNSIRAKDILERGGNILLGNYEFSLYKLLFSNYPDHLWTVKYPAKTNIDQKIVMDSIFSQFGFQENENWYGVSAEDIARQGGESLIDKYQGSASTLIMSTYPDHLWIPLRWKDKETQKDFLDWIGYQIGIKVLDDWYKVTNKKIVEMGGDSILRSYDGVLYKLMNATYFNHPWIPWRFLRNNNYLELQERIEIILWLEKELKIDDLEEWYRVSLSLIETKVSLEFFRRIPLERFLQETHPEHLWDTKRLQQPSWFSKTKSTPTTIAKL